MLQLKLDGCKGNCLNIEEHPVCKGKIQNKFLLQAKLKWQSNSVNLQK